MPTTRSGGLLVALGAVLVLLGLAAAVALQFDIGRSQQARVQAVARVQQLLEAQASRELTMRGELIAGNQAVVAYMTQALGSALPGEAIDASSIVDLLEERRAQLKLDVAAVVAPSGRLLATTDPVLRDHDFAADPVLARVREQQLPQTGLWNELDALRHVAMIPLARYGSGDAFLVVGQEIGGDFLQTLSAASGSDLALTAQRGGEPVLVASTLPAAQAAAVAGDSALPPLFGNREVVLVAVPPAGGDAAALRLHLPLLLFALLASLALLLGLGWYWHGVARPLQALVHLLQRAADTGDVHLRMEEAGTPPVRAVAQAFNRLMASLRGVPR